MQSQVAENLLKMRTAVANRARIVAVSKIQPLNLLQDAYDAGQRDFGENYVEEMVEKASELPKDIIWHMTGHLQSKKVNKILAVENLMIQTVDTEKLASKLNKACESASRSVEVMIQVNTSGEASKSGIEPGSAVDFASFMTNSCPNLRLMGVMTIGGVGDLSCFDSLVQVRSAVADRLAVEPGSLHLSMGMSADYMEAIEAGSTCVRVGTSIFGARVYS